MAAEKSQSQSLASVCKEMNDSWGQLNHFVQVLSSRTQAERKEIAETYKKMYGEDLIRRLRTTDQSGISSNTSQALAMLMLSPHERDATVARQALEQSDDIKYMALVEILVSRKSSHVLMIQQVYQARFKRILEHDVLCIEPPHPFQKIVMALIASHKAHNADASQHIAQCDAKRLYQTGEGRTELIDGAVVLEIFSKRSIAQLKLTFACYKHIYGHSYTKSLKFKTNGEFEHALKAVVKCIHTPAKYYSKAVYESIKKENPDRKTLARVIISRAEVDMVEIRRVFKKKYGLELKDVLNIPSGDFRDLLIGLATKNKA